MSHKSRTVSYLAMRHIWHDAGFNFDFLSTKHGMRVTDMTCLLLTITFNLNSVNPKEN